MDWISLLKPLPNSKITQSFYSQLVMNFCIFVSSVIKIFNYFNLIKNNNEKGSCNKL